MTTSTSSPQHAETIDTGPLSWVMGEIRESLARSKTSLREAVSQDAETQSTSLKHAKTYLHQAHGALQIVDIDGIALITETVEDLFERIESGQLALSAGVADAVDNAYQALVEYLGELLSGARHQPVRLFPYYRALLEARGAERIHPADLFFPNLSVRVSLPPGAVDPNVQPDYVMLRKRFERALLPFLKNAGDPASAGAMRDIVGEIEALQSNAQARSFWWVMHGFAEAVASGSVPNEIYIKQLFARINLQLRRLSEGSAGIAERLLRDALFFIARAENPSPRILKIQSAYQIGGAVPADYDRKRYGQVDVEALAQAKDRLSQAKNAWNRIAAGEATAADAFEQEMMALAQACAKLDSAALTKLLRELNGIARHAARANPGDAIGLEIATSLLFVENALTNIAQLPEDFTARAEAMTARLLSIVAGERPSESAPWLDDMSRQAQERQTVGALAAEMQTSLRQVEKTLDEYFNDPSQRAALDQIVPVLHQIEGALAVLDQEDAVRAVRHVQQAIAGFAASEETPSRDAFQHVARNVGALSFFIETLQVNPDGARSRFLFDEQEGVFHARLIEKKPDGGTTTEIELDHADLPVLSVPATTLPAAEAPADPLPEVPLPTVEEELALHQQKSAELAVSLSIEPNNPALQEQLKESLEKVRMEARLVDNPEAGDRARAAIDLLEQADFAHAQKALADIITATVPAQPVAPVPVAPTPPVPTSDEAIDAELLEIFLLEAEEVLGCVRDTLPKSRAEPYNQDHMTTLRRSFHTLKGSSRMVGLGVFGEAAWGIEQVLNVRLSETRPGDADLYALIEKAADELAAWVADLQASGRSDRTSAALAAAAERVKGGGPFVWEDAAPAAVESPAAAPDGGEAEPAAPAPELPAAAAPADELQDPPGIAAPADMRAEAHEAAAPLPDLDLTLDDGLDLPAALPEVTESELSADDFAFLQDGTAPREAAPPASADAADALPPLPELELGDIVDAPALDMSADALSLHEESPATPADDVPAASASDADTAGAESLDSASAPPEVALVAEIIDFPGLQPAQPARDDGVRQIGDITISVPLHNIYLAETDELVRVLSQDISEWRHEPERVVRTQAVHAAHSLAGSSATVGFQALQEIAHALEMVLQFLSRRPVRLEAAEFDLMDHAVDRFRFMLQMFALGEMPDREPIQVHLLEGLLRAVEQRADAALAGHDAPASAEVAPLALPAEPADEVVAPVDEPAPAEPAPVADAVELPADFAAELAAIDAPSDAVATPAATDASAVEESADAAAAIASPDAGDALQPLAEETHAVEARVLDLTAELARLAEAAADTSDAAPVEAAPAIDDIAPDLTAETLPDRVAPAEAAPADAGAIDAVTADAPATIDAIDAAAAADDALAQADAGQAHLVAATMPTATVATADHDAVAEAAVVLKDELDADLLPVFLEEGRDMMPQIGGALRDWQQKPGDRNPPQSLLRLLHTVKGSARMAGAMALGQHLHEMETRIEQLMLIGAPSPQSLDDLLGRYDVAQHMFELLQNPDAARLAAALAAATPAEPAPIERMEEAAVAEAESAPAQPKSAPVEVPALVPNLQARFTAPAAPAAAAPAQVQGAAAPLVRVRADLLDRLVNQAGEVSIARSKLETEVGSLRQSLSELNENVARLRDQLRELEMQAESQITSRMAQSSHEFDPLEFDRFTRLQELTRMMAESVNDVGSVQGTLLRTIDSASTDLSTQARLTRELQQDLMRVRMVQFASISERLYRVTRQAAKETNKRVNLDIRGSAVEIDRGVLEKMVGPFEHLLRNAIAHGIESREQRAAAGKSEIGELLVEIRQEGNEVVIHFADDGQGIDLDRVRAKAKAVGLLGDDGELSDAEVTDLIFHPGFSTANEVTELAGRGVGMDVVRSEAAALGGRVSTWSEPGKGARFTIHLPLTLAVTQVVLLTTGGKTYAVPSVLVEQVQQLKIHALTAAYNDGAVMWLGQRVPLHYLSALLGDSNATPVTQQYSPIIILKSGTDRVAVHVDEVIGNREVVVKNIGPQLARMIGVAGATVLGSGDIVLILNPVPLAQRMAHDHARAPRLAATDAPSRQMGAVAELPPVSGGSEPVQGLRSQRIVMVVDDSLTVRRVTQRLLVREGFQVVLAKDGVDALEHLQSITPDVMLVDIEMPRMDGFDLTRNVRSDERTRHIPIIMITSRTAEKHRNYALELGVNEYLGKPYQEDVLLRLIAGFVQKEAPVA